ncbi:lamin tail domain-containing protein [Patescibacteria group bacterium]|nr:lamin tail domain-containing protein [Patescibacteria group bacterium]
MSTKFFGSIAVVFFLLPAFAHADVVISEIMYDVPGSDSGREWIEVHNTGESAVDISGWKLFESGISHKIIPEKSAVIESGGYAVIADNVVAFRKDWPTYAGIIFESAFSLKNTGEILSLKNASSTVLFETNYETRVAKGDGNSLNNVGATWEARMPSPGGTVHASAVIAKAKPLSGNREATEVVQKSDSAGKARAVSNTASMASFQGSDSSGIIPWALALLGVIGLGVAALMFQRKSRGSGYTIIEEK